MVCQAEGVAYTNDGLEAVVFTADGDMRQALNNLQASGGKCLWRAGVGWGGCCLRLSGRGVAVCTVPKFGVPCSPELGGGGRWSCFLASGAKRGGRDATACLPACRPPPTALAW